MHILGLIYNVSAVHILLNQQNQIETIYLKYLPHTTEPQTILQKQHHDDKIADTYLRLITCMFILCAKTKDK